MLITASDEIMKELCDELREQFTGIIKSIKFKPTEETGTYELICELESKPMGMMVNAFANGYVTRANKHR